MNKLKENRIIGIGYMIIKNISMSREIIEDLKQKGERQWIMT